MTLVLNVYPLEVRGDLVPAPGRPSVVSGEAIAREQIASRGIGVENWGRFEDSIAEIVTAYGLEQGADCLRATALRFLKALHDATAGYEGGAKLLTAFPTGYHAGASSRTNQGGRGDDRLLCARGARRAAVPWVRHVGYVADEQIVGISKPARLVHAARVGRMSANQMAVEDRPRVQAAQGRRAAMIAAARRRLRRLSR